MTSLLMAAAFAHGPGSATLTQSSDGALIVGDWVDLLDNGESETTWNTPGTTGSPSTATFSETSGVITVTSARDGTLGNALDENCAYIQWDLIGLASDSLGPANEYVLDHVTHWAKYRIEIEVGAIVQANSDPGHALMVGIGDSTGAEWIGGGLEYELSTATSARISNLTETTATLTASQLLVEDIYVTITPTLASSIDPFGGGLVGLGTVTNRARRNGPNEIGLSSEIGDAFDGSGSLKFRIAVAQDDGTATADLDIDFTARIRWVQHRDGTEGL